MQGLWEPVGSCTLARVNRRTLARLIRGHIGHVRTGGGDKLKIHIAWHDPCAWNGDLRLEPLGPTFIARNAGYGVEYTCVVYVVGGICHINLLIPPVWTIY